MREIIDGTYRRFRWLVVGYTLSTVISAIATIFIARLMGPEKYGIYTIGLMLPYLFTGLTDIGMSSAVTYYVSVFKDNDNMVGSYLRTALYFSACYSLILVVVVALFAPFFSLRLFGKPELCLYFRISSSLIFSMAISGVCSGALLSVYMQRAIGIYYILSSLARNVFSIKLFLIFKTPLWAAIGQVVGYIFSSIVYMIYTLSKLPKGPINIDLLKKMIKYGFPYGLGIFVTTICIQFYNVIAAIIMDGVTYGNFSAAWVIFSGIIIIPNSLSRSLFPSFSESIGRPKVSIIDAFSSTIKFTSALLLYLWLTTGGISDLLIGSIYGSRYVLAGEIFMYLSLVFVLGVIGWGVVRPVLLSMKETKILAIINIGSVIISIVCIKILLSVYINKEILVIPLAFFILHASSTLFGLIFLNRKYRVKLPIRSILKLLFITLLLFYLTRRIVYSSFKIEIGIFGMTIHLENITKLMIVFVVIGISYFVLLIIFKVITRDDYEVIKAALSTSPLIAKIIGKIAEPAFAVSKKIDEIILRNNKNKRGID